MWPHKEEDPKDWINKNLVHSQKLFFFVFLGKARAEYP